SRIRLSYIMRNAIKLAGFKTPKQWSAIQRGDHTPHGLRYTFAIRAIEMRMDYDTIESIVGHKTLTMAIKYTGKRRKARLLIDTLNEGLKRHREQHSRDVAES